jgi:hypothetical protein
MTGPLAWGTFDRASEIFNSRNMRFAKDMNLISIAQAVFDAGHSLVIYADITTASTKMSHDADSLFRV